MKILGGTLKGRNFYMPADIRPTQNLVRAAVFDILGHDLTGLSWLELFAGSGAMTLEAISRGASDAVLVEHDPKNIKIIEENCHLLGLSLSQNIKVIEADAFMTIKRLAEAKKRFNIVFLDPPFGLKLGKKALNLITSRDILHDQNFVITQLDHNDHLMLPEGYNIITERDYGSSHVTILQQVKK